MTFFSRINKVLSKTSTLHMFISENMLDKYENSTEKRQFFPFSQIYTTEQNEMRTHSTFVVHKIVTFNTTRQIIFKFIIHTQYMTRIVWHINNHIPKNSRIKKAVILFTFHKLLTALWKIVCNKIFFMGETRALDKIGFSYMSVLLFIFAR